MIYQEIDLWQFRDAFQARRPDSFTYEGLEALYNYLWDRSEHCGNEALDVIAIDCEFCEWADLDEFHDNYDPERYPDLETVKDYTTVIMIEGTSRFITGEF